MNEKKPVPQFDKMTDEELAKALFGERATEEIKRRLAAKAAEEKVKRST